MYRVNHWKGLRRKPLAYLLENKPTQHPTHCSTGKGLYARLDFNYNKAESTLEESVAKNKKKDGIKMYYIFSPDLTLKRDLRRNAAKCKNSVEKKTIWVYPDFISNLLNYISEKILLVPLTSSWSWISSYTNIEVNSNLPMIKMNNILIKDVTILFFIPL